MNTQQGGVLLSVSIVVFLIALIAIGSVGWLLWQDAGQSMPAFQELITNHTLPVTPTPSPTVDPLKPQVMIDPTLKADTAQLEEQLVAPLRAYYATKSERLGVITVMASDKPEHTTKVTYDLQQPSGSTQQTFYYDRSGEDHSGPYPKWSPSLLDITE